MRVQVKRVRVPKKSEGAKKELGPEGTEKNVEGTKKSFHITLLFAILQCAAVYYTTLYYVLYAILYYIPPCSVLYFALLYFTTLYYSVLLYDTILFDTVLYHTVLEYTTPSYSLSYDTIL